MKENPSNASEIKLHGQMMTSKVFFQSSESDWLVFAYSRLAFAGFVHGGLSSQGDYTNERKCCIPYYRHFSST